MPHRLGDDPPGNTYPIFCIGRSADGSFRSPECWVLLERIEPEQYASGWEAKRYVNWQGSLWDVKGPCPSEKYVELRCHSYHDGVCCNCVGMVCTCGELYDHCWGKYAEPDEHLLNWIRQTAWEARQDSDVQPLMDAQQFTAPRAQQELVSRILAEQESEKHKYDDLDREITEYWINQPHSVTAQPGPREEIV